jgi:uncharacterized RDD family membrane protein YckC
VDLDESITVATPEGVELRLQLAGLGSRFIAGAADVIIQLLLIVILALLTGALSGSSGVGLAVFAIGTFVITIFYPVLFEVLAGGRPPGKRLSHLRVVRDSGAPVDVTASLIRNLIRLLDGPTLLYLPTIVSIAVTSHNQRPGDLAAGTLVIREQPPTTPTPAPRPLTAATTTAGRSVPRWDTSAITPQETAAVRRFLERRHTLDVKARQELALRLANGLRPKVTSPPSDLTPERFLEEIVQSKRIN